MVKNKKIRLSLGFSLFLFLFLFRSTFITDSLPSKVHIRNASRFIQLFDAKFSLMVVRCQFLRHTRHPDVDEKCILNGRLYVYIRGTLGKPGASSTLVKSLFPAVANGNLEMKRLRDKISRHRQGLTYSLRHVVRAFLRHSGRETEEARHMEERTLLSASSCAVSRKRESFLQIYHRTRKVSACNVI